MTPLGRIRAKAYIEKHPRLSRLAKYPRWARTLRALLLFALPALVMLFFWACLWPFAAIHDWLRGKILDDANTLEGLELFEQIIADKNDSRNNTTGA